MQVKRGASMGRQHFGKRCSTYGQIGRKRAQQRPLLHLTLLTALTLSLGVQPVLAQDSKLDRLETTAQTSYDQQDYKKSAYYWAKLLTELTKDNGGADTAMDPATKAKLEKTYRSLAQCAINQADYRTASGHLESARLLTVQLGTPDTELDKAYSDLSASYQEIDPASLGEQAATALKEVGAQKITVAKTTKGQHIEVLLVEKFIKQIGTGTLSQVSLDKVIAFDFSEMPDGMVRIDNISGLKAKVKVWVDVIASKLRRDSNDQPVAEVTGAKLGMTQSVSTKLPDDVYQPVMGIITRVKTAFAPGAQSGGTFNNVATAGSNSNVNGNNTASNTGTAVGGSPTGGALTGSSAPGVMVPVVNKGQSIDLDAGATNESGAAINTPGAAAPTNVQINQVNQADPPEPEPSFINSNGRR
ncbi:MAG: hypothetical protein IPP97_06695 [Candidatus Obscuribacter sp.]|nr:hypothetical protein [Candidatus Obscuribacter sp.]MBP6591389.1 hypothetical protein [Candidatus Obscuribacter sp.]MBP7576499.1 hypothetical protein [Candidatus Obscuribacter sp.]